MSIFSELSFKSKSLYIFHLAVIVGAFTYIFENINWPQAWIVFNHVDWRWVGMAVLCSFLSLMPLAKRYAYLLNASAVHYTFLMAYRDYLSGAFISIIFPGVISGDVLRIWLCNRDSSATLLLASSIVLIERLIGVVALTILLSLGMLSVRVMISLKLTVLIDFLTVTGVLAIAFIPWLMKYLTCIKLTSKNKYIKLILDKVNPLKEKLALLKTIKSFHLYIGLCLSVAAQLFDMLATYFLAQSLGFNLNFQIIMVVLSLSYLMTALPISPGGLGVRESIFVLILTWYNIPASEAALLALSVFIVRIIVGLVGSMNGMVYDSLSLKLNTVR